MAEPARVFLSYSHADEAWKDRLVAQLGVLERAGKLRVWDDRRIGAGADWPPAIETELAGCAVALLLISADFLNSRFILDTEVPRLLQRRARGGLTVIPVFVRPCPWRRIDWINAIQGRPSDGRELSGMSPHDAEAALAALALEIDDLLGARALDAERPGRHPHAERGDEKTQPQRPRVEIARLPAGAAHFLGREEELRMLDAAWSSEGDAAGLQVVALVAPGGVGKTALIKRWLDGLRREGWRGAELIFGWSFYSQGTGDDRQASDDVFLSEALAWFKVDCDPAASPWDKGRLLADAVAARRTLLVLDGCEPLQQPPGPLAGQLRTPGLKALLGHLAGSGQLGLTLLSTREALTDLAEYARSPGYPQGAVLVHDLERLDEADGARLLHRLGCVRAGAAAIGPEDDELRAASREVRGHALTLNLLGRYLAQAQGGDIRRRDTVDLMDAADSQGGHTFRVLAAYEAWFTRAAPGAGTDGTAARQPTVRPGAAGAPGGAVELAALRLLGLFDRPADAGCIRALREAPAIPGLTEPLMDLSQARWNLALSRLAECGLIERGGAWGTGAGPIGGAPGFDLAVVGGGPQRTIPGAGFRHPAGMTEVGAGPQRTVPGTGFRHPAGMTDAGGITGAGGGETAVAGTGVPQPAGLTGVGAERQTGAPAAPAIDAHPLVREYLGLRLRESHPDAWREGHRRLYAFLKQSVPQRPEGPAGLQPLYQAVAHGCLAGSQQEACAEVFHDRIRRGSGNDGAYSWKKLGAFGADLGAVACFFDEPWQRISAALTESDRAWLLSQAAVQLRALGRLTEALEPMRAGLEMVVRREDWKNAAIYAGNLSELGLTLGLVSDALADGERSVDYADRSGDAFWRMASRATLADALHQQGQRGPAFERFREAESMQAQRQPQYPLLYSVPGYRYCDLLLAAPERAAWRALPARWERLQPRREAAATEDASSRLKPLPPGLRDDLGDHSCRARFPRARQPVGDLWNGKQGGARADCVAPPLRGWTVRQCHETGGAWDRLAQDACSVSGANGAGWQGRAERRRRFRRPRRGGMADRPAGIRPTG
ncbi:TIR domain-containing protein [uncultured Thiodictyon sp.]|uniref:TIR domain-containing protein n=1 Tax=uncultured Thiodictyon sp. TaxID=1846217 RepID=UPI0025FEA1B7|nr:TIR domain-containing protein [uncultured Thiodictyon sp.]